MDFPDLTEYIGPIIFGLIAWLSNYFSKKKKPTEQTEIEKKKTNESLPNELTELYNKIISPEKVDEVKDEINFSTELKKPNVEKEIIDEVDIIKNNDEDINSIVKEEISDDSVIESRYDTNKKDKPTKKTISKRNNIRDRIKSKNGLKEAFILKEILDRKYD